MKISARKNIDLRQSSLVATGLICSSVAALAQSSPTPPALSASAVAPAGQQLQTVTITAERREENIKNVPVSASTLSGDIVDAMNAGGQDMQMLSARAPSLAVESSFGRAYPRFYIRGYGNVDFHQNASQPVSLVYDDVVQESPVLKGFPPSTSTVSRCCAGRRARFSAATRRPASSSSIRCGRRAISVAM